MSQQTINLPDLLALAHDMADAAAQQTLPLFRQAPQVDNKHNDGFDPVTQADRNAEQAIRQIIESNCPEHAILGEEYGAKAGNALQWVLDPIDGTRAFISGAPSWGTLIALNNDGAPLLGIMDQPFTGERYSACAGHGAFLAKDGHKTQLATRACADLQEAIMATTTPDLFEDAQGTKIWQAIRQTVRLTRYGGDCYNYALLAAGHIDIVFEQGLQAYDIQALVPIVREAGGVVTDWQGGDPMQGGQIIACGDARLHDKALSLIGGL